LISGGGTITYNIIREEVDNHRSEWEVPSRSDFSLLEGEISWHLKKCCKQGWGRKYKIYYGPDRGELGGFGKQAEEKTKQYNIKYDCFRVFFITVVL
jgi:hypothetical protein